jgi:hypothetical protein
MALFADSDLAQRIEAAEASLTRDVTLAVQGAPGGAQAFVQVIAGGVGAFARPGSPMNKVIGLGLTEDLEEAALAELEGRYRAAGEPVRVELATLARAEVAPRLTARGYRLVEVIAQAVKDVTRASGFQRYLAHRGGQVVGGASMRLQGSIALLTGATTLTEWRRRGVQGALLTQRLGEAQRRGAALAVITTGVGTRSQANALRHGFDLIYARAILVRP